MPDGSAASGSDHRSAKAATSPQPLRAQPWVLGFLARKRVASIAFKEISNAVKKPSQTRAPRSLLVAQTRNWLLAGCIAELTSQRATIVTLALVAPGVASWPNARFHSARALLPADVGWGWGALPADVGSISRELTRPHANSSISLHEPSVAKGLSPSM